MKSRSGILYFLGLIILCHTWGCTIQEEIHFNKDYSGKVSFLMDLSSATNLVKSFQPDSLKDQVDARDGMELPNSMMSDMEKLRDLEGISNIQTETDESGVFKFSFDFANIQALNEAYGKMRSQNGATSFPGLGNPEGGFQPGPTPDENEESTVETVEEEKEPFIYFEQNGKYLTYRIPQVDLKKEDMEGMGLEGNMMQGFGEVLTWNTIFSFDRKLKKSYPGDLTIKQEDNKITVKQGIGDLFSRKENAELKVKLK